MTQKGTAWRKALAFSLALFLALTNLPAGFLGAAEEIFGLGISNEEEISLGESGRETAVLIRVKLEEGGSPPSGILLTLLDAEETPLLEEELDEDDSVRWQLPTDDDVYLLYITLPDNSRSLPGEGWQRADHNVYRKSFSRRQLTDGELVIQLEEPPVVEEIPPEPFLVSVAVFEYDGEERVPVPGLRLLFADADSGEGLASATSQGDIEVGLLLTTHSTRLKLIATGLEDSYAFADEEWAGGARVFSLEELTGLSRQVEIELAPLEPEWEPLMLHISLDQQIQVSPMRAVGAALTGNSWLTGMVNMNGLTLKLENAAGGIIAQAPTEATSSDGLKGAATLAIPMPIEDEDQFILRLSGLRGSTHEVVTEGWELDGVDFVLEISGKDLKKLGSSGGAVEITLARRTGVKVLTFKSSDGDSTVTVETYAYSDTTMSNCLDTEIVEIDDSVGNQYDFFFSNEYRYRLSIEAESPDHHWFNTSYNAVDDALYITYEGMKGYDDDDVPDVYILKIDPAQMESAEFITTFFVTPYLDLVVDKEYAVDGEGNKHKPDGPIWIGLRDVDAHKAGNPDAIQWVQGPQEDDFVLFNNVRAYQYTYYLDSNNAYRVTRSTRSFHLMEYLPVSTEPQGFRVGQPDENFTPPGGINQSNYLFYINSDSPVRLTSRPKIVNQEANIYFDTGDFGGDFAGRLVTEVYQGNFAEWIAKKYIVTDNGNLVTSYTKTFDGAREDRDFTVDYQVEFTKNVKQGGDSYRIYFKNISVYFSYDVRAAFGNNKIVGEMRLLRRDAGSSEYKPVEGQIYTIDALLSSGSLGERYGDLEIEGINFVDTEFSYQNMPAYRLEFTGGYLFSSDGSPDINADLRPITNLSIDISPAVIPPQSGVITGDNLVFDNNLRSFEDTLQNLEDPGNYRFNGLVKDSLLINGQVGTGTLTTTDTGFLYASLMDVLESTGKLVFNYTYSYTDLSRENLKPCADSYTIENQATGVKSTTKTPVTSNKAVVTVKVSTYAQFNAVKLDHQGAIYSQDIPFRLEQWISGGWQPVASGTAQGAAITLEDSSGKPFRIYNPDGTERLRLLVEVPKNSHPPFTLVDGSYVKWTHDSGRWWYFDFDPLGDYFSRATQDGENNKYCGIFTFTVYDLPDSSIKVEKGGEGSLGSVFYFYPVDDKNALGAPHTVTIDNTGGGSLSNLPFGKYEVYEVTRSEFRPVEGSGSNSIPWTLVGALPDGGAVGAGYRVYHRQTPVELTESGANITLTVSNDYLDHLVIEKAVPEGAHPDRSKFTFTVTPKGGNAPLSFVLETGNPSPHQAVYRHVAEGTPFLTIDFTGLTGTAATLKVTGLPEGDYVVSESAIDPVNGVVVYDGHPDDCEVTLGNSKESSSAAVFAKFINKLRGDDASITIIKEATGDFSQRFLFQVTGVNLQDGSAAFAVTKSNGSPAAAGSYAIVSKDTFVMAAGHKAVISKLTLGGVYTVTEIDTEAKKETERGNLAYYDTTVAVGSGTPQAGSSATLTAGDPSKDVVTFHNARKGHTGKITLEKMATLWPDSGRFTFELHRYDYSTGLFELVAGSSQEIQGKDINTIEWSGLHLGVPYRIYETASLGMTPAGWKYDPDLGYYYEFTLTAADQTVSVRADNKLTELTVKKETQGNIPSTETFQFQVQREDSTAVWVVPFGTKGNAYLVETWVSDSTGRTDTIDILPGETVTIYGLPQGEKFTVVETVTGGYLAVVQNGGEFQFDQGDDSRSISITNTNKATILVTKTVVGESSDSRFDFILYQLPATGDPTDSDIVNLTVNGTQITAHKGDAKSFSLKGGQSATITGLLKGATYAVVEVANPDYTTVVTGDGANIAVSSNPGASIEIDRNSVTGGGITFTNTLNPVLYVAKQTVGATDGQVFQITVERLLASGETDFSWTPVVLSFSEASGDGNHNVNTPVAIPGVSAGYRYRVTEAVAEFYEASGTIYQGVNATGDTTSAGTEYILGGEILLSAGDRVRVDVTNTRRTGGDLTIVKQVVGDYEDQPFSFTISPPVGTVGTFTLKDGESKTFSGLDHGAVYTITEIEADSPHFEFVEAKTGNDTFTDSEVKLTVPTEQETLTLTYYNERKSSGSIELKKSVNSATTWPDGQEFSFRLYRLDGDDNWELVGDKETATKDSPVVTWTNLTEGSRYRIVEAVDSGDPFYPADWSYDAETGYYTELELNGSATVNIDVVNTRRTGDLSLTKTSSHDSLWPEEGFRFQLRHRDDTGAWSLWGDNAERTFQPGGGAQVWSDLPTGETFRIYEVNAGLYRLGSGDGWNEDSIGFYREFTVQANQTLNVTAHNALTELSVSKVVVNGTGGGTFHFQVQQGRRPLTFRQVEESENLYCYDAAADLLSLPIRDGETVTLLGLPLGNYQVVETESGGHIASYPNGDTAAFTEESMEGAVTIANGAAPTQLTLRKTVTNRNTAVSFSAVVREQLADGSAGRYLRFHEGVFQGYTDAQDGAVLLLQPGVTVTLTGMPVGSYLVQEVNIPSNYALSSIDQPSFQLSGEGEAVVWQAHAEIYNRYTSGGGGGGGGSSSGGGRDTPDSVTHSGSSGNPTVDLEDGGIPLIDIEDGPIPQAGGLPIELALLLGGVLLVTGVFLKRRQAKENDVK